MHNYWNVIVILNEIKYLEEHVQFTTVPFKSGNNVEYIVVFTAGKVFKSGNNNISSFLQLEKYLNLAIMWNISSFLQLDKYLNLVNNVKYIVVFTAGKVFKSEYFFNIFYQAEISRSLIVKTQLIITNFQ